MIKKWRLIHIDAIRVFSIHISALLTSFLHDHSKNISALFYNYFFVKRFSFFLTLHIKDLIILLKNSNNERDNYSQLNQLDSK